MAEVVRRLEGPLLKSLDLDKNLKSQYMMIFYLNIKIRRDSHTFWKTLAKKRAFWVKNSVFGIRSALSRCIYCISD